MADRYLYASLAGLGLLAGGALREIPEGGPRAVLVACLGVAALTGGSVLERRAAAFASEDRLLEELLSRPGAPVLAWRLRVEALLRGARPGPAAAAAEAGLAAVGEDHGLRLLLARARLAAGDLEGSAGALEPLEAASLATSEARLALVNRAYLLRRMERLEEAGQLLDRLLQAAPELAAGFALRGELRMARGDLAGARQDLGRARELAPGVPTTRFNLALLDHRQGRVPEAAEALLRLAEEHPEEARFAGALAQVLRDAGRGEEAARWAREALARGGREGS
jgi:tetratricopeptide (TPR) repeat protein